MALVATLASGQGLVNGDQAVYLWEASQSGGPIRWTHVGYIFLLRVLPQLSSSGADYLSCVFFGGSIGLFAWREMSRGHSQLASIYLVFMVLPWAPFGEVDTAWFFLAVLAVLAPPVWGFLFAGLMVTVSPTALAGIPVLVWWRRDVRWLGAAFATLVLIVVSSGDWLWGTRGVLTGGWLSMPGRQLQSLMFPIFALVLLSPWATLQALLLGGVGLMAPADVPGHWWAGLVFARYLGEYFGTATRLKSRLVIGLLVFFALQSSLATRTTCCRLREETEALREVSGSLERGDAVVGSWSMTQRVQVHVPFLIPRRGESEVSEAFCRVTIRRLILLPGVQWPGEVLHEGKIRFVNGSDQRVKKGCEQR